MGHDAVALTDGGLETVLLFHEGFDLPCFAAFPLLDDERGRAALRRYFGAFPRHRRRARLPVRPRHGDMAGESRTGATRLGYDADALAIAECQAVEFARELARRPLAMSRSTAPSARAATAMSSASG